MNKYIFGGEKIVVGIIPCRYESSRFQETIGLINNKPMMWHVYQRCLESGVLDKVYIAADDERIELEAETRLRCCDDL